MSRSKRSDCLGIAQDSEYDQGIKISSENCGSPTANIATTVLCTIYDQNTYKVNGEDELALSTARDAHHRNQNDRKAWELYRPQRKRGMGNKRSGDRRSGAHCGDGIAWENLHRPHHQRHDRRKRARTGLQADSIERGLGEEDYVFEG
ncbi:hypothetical protein B0H17DRAFT_1123550 [Mycena rosella]|uniref:Uncharacterized protein n=1 Tax=Mycena rosella TaxID=1033263 RepID=A0AAD7H2E5_MYCRO|nr:hypothetical protein B0H17DRAFT_1123550 [Mycena rosella]